MKLLRNMSVNAGQIPLKVGRTEFAHAHVGGLEDWVVFWTLEWRAIRDNLCHTQMCSNQYKGCLHTWCSITLFTFTFTN